MFSYTIAAHADVSIPTRKRIRFGWTKAVTMDTGAVGARNAIQIKKFHFVCINKNQKLMKTFIKSVFGKPWLIMSGMYIVAFLGIVFPSFAEWPLVPVIFIALLPTFVKHVDNPRFDRFAAMVLGALSVQVLFWIG